MEEHDLKMEIAICFYAVLENQSNSRKNCVRSMWGVCAAAGFHNLAGREGSGDSRKKAERAGEAWGKMGTGLGCFFQRPGRQLTHAPFTRLSYGTPDMPKCIVVVFDFQFPFFLGDNETNRGM